jgi:hypothetical protein
MSEKVVLVLPATTEVRLSTGAVLEVRAPSLVVQRSVGWRAQRPLHANYRAYTNELLAGCIGPAPKTAIDIDALSKLNRRRLMLAVVRLRDAERDWRTLHGSHLSLDERFFAVMRISPRAGADEILEFIREMRKRNERVVEEAAKAVKVPQYAFPPGLFESPALRAISGLSAVFATQKRISQMVSGFKGAQLAPLMDATHRSALLSPFESSGVAQVMKASKSLRLAQPGLVASVGQASQVVELARGRLTGFESGLAAVSALSRPPLLDAVRNSSSLLPAAAMTDGLMKSMQLSESPALRMLRDPLWTGHLAGLPAIPKFDFNRSFIDGLQPLFEQEQQFADLSAFIDAWSRDPLWFFLNLFGMRAARSLVGRTREEVRAAIADALEQVVRGDELVPLLRKVVHAAPFLDETPRDHLDHGLEHAQRGEWRKAVLQMLVGLEGALYSAAVANNWYVDQGGRIVAAEKLVQLMQVDEAFAYFVRRLVYADRGNPPRHGRPAPDERETVLFAIVALAGWADEFLDRRLTPALAAAVAQHLPAALPPTSE